MAELLVVGGTRFIGRHTVEAALETGHDVTVFNRGNHENPFDDRVGHVEGDRTVEGELRLAATRIDPDLVVDTVAYHPRDVRVATEVFADVDAYVYVSSGAAYGAERVPKREDETPLHGCTNDQATDDTAASYGPRKAEGDRAVFEAAARGVNATSVRPPVVYGPYDYTGRFDYWIDRVLHHDRVLVPGDGTNLWHRAYVGDVADALLTVAEAGEPGEAYNVGDGHVPTLVEWVDLLATAAGEPCSVVTAGERELSAAGLSPTDFPGYRDPPHLLSTAKLRDLGWRPTPHEEALAATITEHREADRTGREQGPDRAAEETVLSILDTL
jgi:nucleoside-diphosphate-sugar epimerase